MDTSLLIQLLTLLLFFIIVHHIVKLVLPGKRRPLPPGPRGYPIVGCLPLLIGQAPHVTLAELAKQYGPLMNIKMGKHNNIVASTAAAARLVLKTHESKFLDRPIDTAATVHVFYGGQDIAASPYGPRWKLLRKICSLNMLGPKALESWEEIRRTEMVKMTRIMFDLSKKGESINLPELLSVAMTNVIGQVILGRRVFHGLTSEATQFRDMVVELMTIIGLFNIGDYVPALAWLDLQGLVGRMKRVHKKFVKLLRGMIDEHEKSASVRVGKRDILDVMVEHQKVDGPEGIRLNDENVTSALLDLFAAGTDTSSSAIEWSMAELLHNPSILKRAQDEMDQVIGRDRLLKESDLANLPYLKAICKEAFRKHPSTPLNLPRLCTEDCEADGYFIPKDSRLLVNIWAIGRDPDVWENPLEFNPDRFMTEKGAKMQPNGSHFELIPFGAGRRICVGARMGVLMVEYILGTLIHSFNWELPAGVDEVDMGEAFGIALQKAIPVSAMVRPRLAPYLYI